MITVEANGRTPGPFLPAHLLACMLMGFNEEAKRTGLTTAFSEDTKDPAQNARYTVMTVAAGRLGYFYNQQFETSTATVNMTSKDFDNIVVKLGEHFATVLKNEERQLAEHEIVAAFHEQIQAYRIKA